jgi:type II secretory pathway component GspD/PulD (secretin)
VFQAKTRGWKRLAASLVLLPGLTAVGAEVLHLLGTTQAQEPVNSRPAAPVKTATSEDPRALVKRAREAADSSRFDMAFDLAQQAEINGRNTKWGLFEDTPESILKDIQKARARVDRQKAERLVGQARALYEKRTGGDEQRAANLDKARSLCLEAIQLQGPSSMWYFGDRPETLIKDIDSARSRINVAVRPTSDSAPGARVAPKTDIRVADSQISGATASPTRMDETRPPAPSTIDTAPLPAGDGLGGGTVVSKPFRKSKTPVVSAGAVIPPPQLPDPVVKVASDASSPKLPDQTEPKPSATVAVQLPPIIPSSADAQAPPKLPDQTEPKPSGAVAVQLPPTIPSSGDAQAPPKLPVPIEVKPSVTVGVQLPHIIPSSTDAQAPPKLPVPIEVKPSVTVADRSPNMIPASADIEFPQPAPATVAKAPDPNKLHAVELMQQAVVLQTQHKFVESRQALLEAKKLKASFGPDEDTPDMALQSLLASAQKQINGLCREAHELMLKQTAEDVAKAERQLVEANTAAVGLELDPWMIEEHRLTLNSIKTRMSGVASVKPVARTIEVTRASIVLPEPRVADPMGNVGPSITGNVDVPAPIARSVDVPAPVAPPVDQGMELLKQARLELNNAQIENAKRIVYEILNGDYTCKREAESFLRTCEAQELEIREQSAQRSFEHGVEALQSRNYEQALGIFKLVDPKLLKPAKRKALADYMVIAAKSLDKSANVVQVGVPPVDPEKSGADNLVKQEEAMRELQFQKFRSEGLQLEANATARFGRGDTDGALQDLDAFIARVNAANIDPSKKVLLNRPIESRIERLRVLKHQQDFLTKETKGLKDFRAGMSQAELQTNHKKEEAARLMKDFTRLMQEGKYQDANKCALMAKEVDPEDPSITAAIEISKMRYRKDKWDREKAEDEKTTWEMNSPGGLGPTASVENPVIFNKEHFEQMRNRPSTSGGFTTIRSRTAAEKKIEAELSSTLVNLSFNNTPLEEVIDYLHKTTGLNFVLDTRALQSENVPVASPIKITLNSIVLKSALEAILLNVNLRYVVDKDVIRVTTQKGAAGKLVQQTVPVADLVIPVQNYNPDPITNLNTVLTRGMQDSRPSINGSGAATTPSQPALGLNSSMGSAVGAPSSMSGPGTLRNVQSGPGSNVSVRTPTGTIEESLIHLITSSVRPDTWEAMGGAGRIEYYPIGMALVINQTPDVIEEVIRLLEQLRQLQDLEVAIEVRMITLAETFYERMGLDFSMNINTHNKNALLQVVGSTASQSNLTNLQNVSAKVVGLQAPGIPTPDLNLPITSGSFAQAVPPFGGYAPGADGGLNIGLAFLSDVQVQMFLDAAQADRRTNVMQAPKLTMFNGQSASISIQDQQFFLTGITVTSVSGVMVFTPQNNPFPLGIQMNMQPVVSGDRRFVRLNIQQSMTNLTSATVPLFPITTIVTPTFDGGVQGQPIPFTQYIQQPSFTTISVSTTVVVPDGGTVLLGGLKTLSEGRNEFGPPVLSKIPYIDRLFRNVGYGRDTQSLMMMVTPRIIINREEQEKQTGVVENGGEQ